MPADYDDLVRYIQAWSIRTGAHVTEVALLRENGKSIVLWLPAGVSDPPEPPPQKQAAIPATNASAHPGAELRDERGSSISQCVSDILATLEEVGQPLTTTRLLNEMSKRKREWSDRSVSRHLAEMVRDGTLETGEGKRPLGYRLPEWSKPLAAPEEQPE